jgi:hypothetical protein
MPQLHAKPATGLQQHPQQQAIRRRACSSSTMQHRSKPSDPTATPPRQHGTGAAHVERQRHAAPQQAYCNGTASQQHSQHAFMASAHLQRQRQLAQQREARQAREPAQRLKGRPVQAGAAQLQRAQLGQRLQQRHVAA